MVQPHFMTLTQNVPNNESLLVTLNGVVQHPTTGGVTGSYAIVSGFTNKLQFTTCTCIRSRYTNATSWFCWSKQVVRFLVFMQELVM